MASPFREYFMREILRGETDLNISSSSYTLLVIVVFSHRTFAESFLTSVLL